MSLPSSPDDVTAGGPLSGVRVLDLSAYVAGPFACTLLGDLGADVIKVEPPGGDNLRNYPSTLEGACRMFLGVNRGKRSIVLDLKQDQDMQVLHRLVGQSDVMVHNFRPGVAERLGIGWEQMQALNPRLIYAGLSGYGDSGPLAARAGFDQVLQTMSGICVAQAEPGEAPQIVHGSIVDYYAASMLALGLSSALYAREHTGRGQRLGVSLMGAAMCLQSGRFVWAEGEAEAVDRNTRSTGVNAIFPTKEGHIYLSATTPHFWSALCRLIGCEEMASDPAYATPAKRAAHRDEIAARITTALAARTAVEWEALLAGEVPCAVASPMERMFEHPQMLAQGHVVQYQGAGMRYRGFGSPMHFDGQPLAPTRAAPALGQHQQEILREAGQGQDA